MVEEIISDDMFIVGITINSGNAIAVTVDSETGIDIDKCVEISRHIEKNLDRNAEDFSLEVSSPGLDAPLKIPRQFYKNIGRKIEVIALNGERKEGILKAVNKEGFELESIVSETVVGKRTQIKSQISYSFGDIKTVKLVITFK